MLWVKAIIVMQKDGFFQTKKNRRRGKMGKITVAEKIMEFRHRNNLTQGEFGKLLGISAQAISKWEREVCYPDITILPDLAEALGCTVNDFFE